MDNEGMREEMCKRRNKNKEGIRK